MTYKSSHEAKNQYTASWIITPVSILGFDTDIPFCMNQSETCRALALLSFVLPVHEPHANEDVSIQSLVALRWRVNAYWEQCRGC